MEDFGANARSIRPTARQIRAARELGYDICQTTRGEAHAFLEKEFREARLQSTDLPSSLRRIAAKIGLEASEYQHLSQREAHALIERKCLDFWIAQGLAPRESQVRFASSEQGSVLVLDATKRRILIHVSGNGNAWISPFMVDEIL